MMGEAMIKEQAMADAKVTGTDALEALDAAVAADAGDGAGASAGIGPDERPVLAGAGGGGAPTRGGAFTAAYLRRGAPADGITDGITDGIEVKALSGASGPEGGYLVPEAIDALIGRVLADRSPLRSLARVVATTTSGYRKLITTRGMASGWVGETAPRPETASLELAEIVPPTGTLYANPAVSQAMLDDAGFDLEAWLADEIAAEFARAEGRAFLLGSGMDQPAGLLTVPTTRERDGQRAASTLQYVPTGTAGALGAGAADRLVELVHALRAPYRQGAVWLMNSQTLALVRKLKTADGAFLWQPGLAEGQAASLLGHKVVEAEDMPDPAPGSLSIAFGNFQAGYVIADRGGTQILRDPYSNKPFVHFYATRRVGGCVTDAQAIKLLKFSAE